LLFNFQGALRRPRGQPVYYTTVPRLCQHLFLSFFKKFFIDTGRSAVPSEEGAKSIPLFHSFVNTKFQKIKEEYIFFTRQSETTCEVRIWLLYFSGH